MAKNICAQLLTRAIKGLTEDQEEAVVDYLESMGIEVDLDMKPSDLCSLLLRKSLEEEYKGRSQPPLSAYANKFIETSNKENELKRVELEKREIERKRKVFEKQLEEKSKNLPGCIPEEGVFPKSLIKVDVDPEVGIMKLQDGTSQYSAAVSLPEQIYLKIFDKVDNPVLELVSNKGYKAYARLGDPNSLGKILISPLLYHILGESENVFLRLCSSLPFIKDVKFTYYGTNTSKEQILPELINKLPEVVNAFSYLSLGLVLLVNIGTETIRVRVDRLRDNDDMPIFAGLVPPGINDLPFEIEADM